MVFNRNMKFIFCLFIFVLCGCSLSNSINSENIGINRKEYSIKEPKKVILKIYSYKDGKLKLENEAKMHTNKWIIENNKDSIEYGQYTSKNGDYTNRSFLLNKHEKEYSEEKCYFYEKIDINYGEEYVTLIKTFNNNSKDVTTFENPLLFKNIVFKNDISFAYVVTVEVK